MAIRQEIYTIYVTPYIKVNFGGAPVTVFSDKNTSLYITNPTHQGGGDPHIQLNKSPDEQFWISYYSDNSLDKIRAIYKELIENLGEEYVKVEKQVPTDTLIKPYA